MDPLQARGVAPSYKIFRNLLAADHCAELVSFACSQEQRFGPTLVSAGDAGSRRSAGLPEFEHHLREMIQKRIIDLVGRHGTELAGRPFLPIGLQLQLTAYRDGDFFRMHRDRSDTVHADRVLTCVYYFHTTPKQFRGGALRLYSALGSGDSARPAGLAFEYLSVRNSLIMFPSDTFHEVTPVRSVSPSFAGSRFTLNGWVLA